MATLVTLQTYKKNRFFYPPTRCFNILCIAPKGHLMVFPGMNAITKISHQEIHPDNHEVPMANRVQR